MEKEEDFYLKPWLEKLKRAIKVYLLEELGSIYQEDMFIIKSLMRIQEILDLIYKKLSKLHLVALLLLLTF